MISHAIIVLHVIMILITKSEKRKNDMRTYSNKLIAIMSVLLLACLIVSGCSSSQNNNGSGESKSKDSRVIHDEEGKTTVAAHLSGWLCLSFHSWMPFAISHYAGGHRR